MKRKMTINFTVSLDAPEAEERQLADFLINGIAVDEEGIDFKNGKSLVIYALKYLALKKNKGVTTTRVAKPISAPCVLTEAEEVSDEPQSGLGMFFRGKS